MNLPSKKFIIVVLLTVVIGTGLFSVVTFLNRKTIFTQEEAGALAPIQENNAPVFLNLIDENTEPVSAGFGISGNEAVNLTEAVSKELLTRLILQGNTEVSESDISNALNTLFEETATVEPPRIYSESSIEKASGNTADLKTYGNTFMLVIGKHAEANAASTLNAFERALTGKDDNSVRTLQKISDEYRKMESDMLSIPTPEKLLRSHLDFVNTLRAIGNAVTDMGFVLADPVRGTLGLSTYIKQLDHAWALLHSVYQTFEAEKIQFAPNESGSAWKNFQ